MSPRPVRALACLLGAAFSFSAFFVWSEWSNGYLLNYGTFAPAHGDLALRLHLLLFVLPGTVLMAAAVADLLPSRLLMRFDALGGRRRGGLWPIAGALLILVLSMGIRVGVLREAPITDDENVYLFQARILASGRLYAPSLPEPVRPFFDNQFIVNNGRWFGSYFLGHPAVLALALKLGLVEWVGPIEAALTFLLAVGIARRLFGERTAILAGALLALSPFFLFLSASHLSQPTSSLMLVLFWYAVLRLEGAPRAARWWALAAAALSFGILTRPQTAVFLSLPFLIRVGFLLFRGRLRPGAMATAAPLAILALGAATFLGINHALTGSAFRTGYHAYMAQGIKWLFPFGPFYTIREMSYDIAHVNFWLFGWPVSLAFLPFFRREGAAWALAATPVVAIVWYGLVAVPTVAAVGPVYFGETIVPLAVLSASGIEGAVAFARVHFGDSAPTRTLLAWPVAASLASLLVFVPIQTASLRLSAEIVRAPYELVERQHLKNAVVFVHSLPSLSWRPGTWVYFHRNNHPDLSDPVLFVKDLGPEKNTELMRAMPDRAPFAMGVRDRELLLVPLRP